MYIAITLLFGFSAVNTGNNLIFLIVSALLSFMAVSGVLGWLNIKGAGIGIDLPDEIYSGKDTLVTISLINSHRRLPIFLLKVKVLAGTASFETVAAGQEEKKSLTVRFDERGIHTIGTGQVSSCFPINFFVRARWVALDRGVTVFPAPLSSPLPDSRQGDERGGGGGSRQKGYEGDLAKISDYSGAEPLKLVHWRLSAKYDEVKVKEFAATSPEPVVLDLAAIDGRDLEAKLSRAAFLVNGISRTNRPVGLKLGEKLLEPATGRHHRLRLLTELACHGKN